MERQVGGAAVDTAEGQRKFTGHYELRTRRQKDIH